MKTYELIYLINVPNDMRIEEVRNFLMYHPHNKKLINVKEHEYVDIVTKNISIDNNY